MANLDDNPYAAPQSIGRLPKPPMPSRKLRLIAVYKRILVVYTGVLVVTAGAHLMIFVGLFGVRAEIVFTKFVVVAIAAAAASLIVVCLLAYSIYSRAWATVVGCVYLLTIWMPVLSGYIIVCLLEAAGRAQAENRAAAGEIGAEESSAI